MTPDGQRALDIAQWAWQDPPGRVYNALAQVKALASVSEGQALIEIQDAGTMLTRLAGTLEPQTLSAQLTNDTISSQVIDLRFDPLEHRGPHGEWARAGGPSAAAVAHEATRQASARASHLRRIQQLQARSAGKPKSVDAAASSVVDHMQSKADVVSERAKAAASGGAPSADWGRAVAEVKAGATPPVPKLTDLMGTPPEKFGPTEAHELIKQTYEQELHPQHALHLPDIIKRADQHIEQSLANFKKEEHEAGTDEARKAAQKKMIVEGAVALAGAALAGIIGVLGAPLIAVIAATFGPILVQIGLERKWELAWPT